MTRQHTKKRSMGNRNGKAHNDLENKGDKETQHKLERLIYASLPFYETLFLTVVWVSFLCYEWYLVYPVSQKYYSKFVNDGFMVTTIFNRFFTFQSDHTDRHWNVFSSALVYTIPWIIFHFIGSQVLRKNIKSVVPLFNVILSMTYMTQLMGVKPMIWMCCQPLLMFLVHLMGSSLLIWMMSFTLLFSDYEITGPICYMNNFFLSEISNNDTYLFYVTWYWVNARCVSFCLDMIWKEVEPSEDGKLNDIIEMFSYCFYLPTNVSGPIMVYKDFHDDFNKDYKHWDIQRLKIFIMEVLRYSFWLLIGHVMLHFLYQSAIHHKIHILKSLDFWTLAGVGLSIGGFFNLKYVVLYGWPRPFVVEDGINKAPPPPKCIYRIYRYTEMWRYFDNGLYLFLRKYIYLPIIGNQESAWRKIVGATSTFTFIYLWHGTSNNVMMWSLLNFVSVMLEMLGRAVGKYPAYINIENRLLAARGQRRLHAALGAPLLLGSVLANFYFFMGSNVGNYFVYQVFNSLSFETPLVLLFTYTGAQFSIEIKNYELRKRITLEKLKYE